MRTTVCTALFLLPLAVGCTSSSPIARSEAETDRGNYHLAYRILFDAKVEQQRHGEVSPELEAAWRQARLRHLIERGRNYVFLEHEEAGIDDFIAAMEMAPTAADRAEIRMQIERARDKLAERATRRGEVHLDKREFPEALAAFTEAQEWVPGWSKAVDGAGKVREVFEQMAERAQEQFLEAVRKLPQARFSEVNWHAGSAVTTDPRRDDARSLRQKALRELADQAVKRAAQAEAKGLYGAALVEYRGARSLDPERKDLEEQIAHMQREVRAQQLLEQAAMDLRSDRFEAAKARLDEAFTLSVLERGTISELQLQSRHRQGMIAYEKAKDLELQGQKEAALAAFEVVAKDWPDGLADEKTRIGALRGDVDKAASEWAAGEAAEQAGKFVEAIEHFEAVEIYYAGWKDTKARIAGIKAKQAGSGG